MFTQLFLIVSVLRRTISGPVGVESTVTLCKSCFCQVWLDMEGDGACRTEKNSFGKYID